MQYKARTLSGPELELVIAALDCAMGVMEDDYWDGDSHDSPEDWVDFRQQFNEWAGLYTKLTGVHWVGAKGEWDEKGFHALRPVGVEVKNGS